MPCPGRMGRTEDFWGSLQRGKLDEGGPLNVCIYAMTRILLGSRSLALPEATQKMEGTFPGRQSPRCYSCQSPASGPPAWAACPGEEKNRKSPGSVASPRACPCPGVQPATDHLGHLSSEHVFLCIVCCTWLLFRGSSIPDPSPPKTALLGLSC